jgi:hypothetical protein
LPPPQVLCPSRDELRGSQTSSGRLWLIDHRPESGTGAGETAVHLQWCCTCGKTATGHYSIQFRPGRFLLDGLLGFGLMVTAVGTAGSPWCTAHVQHATSERSQQVLNQKHTSRHGRGKAERAAEGGRRFTQGVLKEKPAEGSLPVVSWGSLPGPWYWTDPQTVLVEFITTRLSIYFVVITARNGASILMHSTIM